MTYREALQIGEEILYKAEIVDAKLDAWYLMEMACKINRNYYYLHEQEDMTQEEQKEFESVLKKRAEHIPLQYITGEQEFMGLKFHVNSNVLIPRQDTETLVEEAIKRIKPGMEILDVCTGSGCVLISILKNVPDVKGIGTDISKQAINLSKENAKCNEVIAIFERSDLFESVHGQFDVITSNPPYIRTEEIVHLMPEVKDFEPIEALDGKEDGLFFYRKIVKDAKEHLKDQSLLLFEIGYDQAEDVTRLMKEEGYTDIKVVKDLAGLDRVVIGKEEKNV